MAHLTAGLQCTRCAGDLISRAQFHNKTKIKESKKFVADKLGIDTFDLIDEQIMRELREELGIGTITAIGGGPTPMEAKMNIEKVLGFEIASCKRFRENTGLSRRV